jgi:hypothetical protein
MYGLVWTVGSIIGNTIGGTFSHPVERIPWLFGSSLLLKRYPFLLPCLITTGCTAAGLIFAWLFLKEVRRNVFRQGTSTDMLYSIVGQSNQAAVYAKLRRSMSITRGDSIAYSAVNKGETEDVEDDEDTTTLVGSPGSPKFLSDEAEEGGERKGVQQHTRQNSVMKGDGRSFLKEIDDEDMQDIKEWGFWEVCAVRSVRRMLASLFLLS